MEGKVKGSPGTLRVTVVEAGNLSKSVQHPQVLFSIKPLNVHAKTRQLVDSGGGTGNSGKPQGKDPAIFS